MVGWFKPAKEVGHVGFPGRPLSYLLDDWTHVMGNTSIYLWLQKIFTVLQVCSRDCISEQILERRRGVEGMAPALSWLLLHYREHILPAEEEFQAALLSIS